MKRLLLLLLLTLLPAAASLGSLNDGVKTRQVVAAVAGYTPRLRLMAFLFYDRPLTEDLKLRLKKWIGNGGVAAQVMGACASLELGYAVSGRLEFASMHFGDGKGGLDRPAASIPHPLPLGGVHLTCTRRPGWANLDGTLDGSGQFPPVQAEFHLIAPLTEFP